MVMGIETVSWVFGTQSTYKTARAWERPVCPGAQGDLILILYPCMATVQEMISGKRKSRGLQFWVYTHNFISLVDIIIGVHDVVWLRLYSCPNQIQQLGGKSRDH